MFEQRYRHGYRDHEWFGSHQRSDERREPDLHR
jgi:hypothetical protein